MTDDRAEDVFNKFVAEIRGQAVLQPPAAGAVPDEPLKVALVCLQAEGKLTQSKARMRRQVFIDKACDPLPA